MNILLNLPLLIKNFTMSKIERNLTIILIPVCLILFSYSTIKSNSERIEKEASDKALAEKIVLDAIRDSSIAARSLDVTVKHDKNPITNTIAVKLSASSSYDSEKDTMGYSWIQIGGPEAVDFKEGSKKSAVNFDATEGKYGFELTITDSYGVSCADTHWVNVAPEPNSCPVVIIKGEIGKRKAKIVKKEKKKKRR